MLLSSLVSFGITGILIKEMGTYGSDTQFVIQVPDDGSIFREEFGWEIIFGYCMWMTIRHS